MDVGVTSIALAHTYGFRIKYIFGMPLLLLLFIFFTLVFFGDALARSSVRLLLLLLFAFCLVHFIFLIQFVHHQLHFSYALHAVDIRALCARVYECPFRIIQHQYPRIIDV